MSNYIIAYRGSKKPATPEDGQAHMARWQAWVADLGDAVVNPGTPCMHAKTVSADGVTDSDPEIALTGYSIVEAESMEAALEIAKSCPFLEMGTLEVAEQMSM